jgi:hypothetical protein
MLERLDTEGAVDVYNVENPQGEHKVSAVRTTENHRMEGNPDLECAATCQKVSDCP